MTRIGQKIIPSLWFDGRAEEAARSYASVFEDSKIGEIVRAGKTGGEIHGLGEGRAMTVSFVLGGFAFIGINGGPQFKFNPSISFLVACRTGAEVDALWAKLSEGGEPLMELGAYPFSERYGWIQDRYGLSWQIMHMGDRPAGPRITPTLMFVGARAGKAEEAMRLYVSVFPNSGIGEILRYGINEEPDREGTVRHAGFALEGQAFAAMDSAYDHKFGFNEAVSFQVLCEDQKEIDDYWEKLSAGGQEGQCGWLKDRFGVSWQVTPVRLGEMLGSPDRAAAERVTGAFLKMRKFDIAELEKVFAG